MAVRRWSIERSTTAIHRRAEAADASASDLVGVVGQPLTGLAIPETLRKAARSGYERPGVAPGTGNSQAWRLTLMAGAADGGPSGRNRSCSLSLRPRGSRRVETATPNGPRVFEEPKGLHWSTTGQMPRDGLAVKG